LNVREFLDVRKIKSPGDCIETSTTAPTRAMGVARELEKRSRPSLYKSTGADHEVSATKLVMWSLYVMTNFMRDSERKNLEIEGREIVGTGYVVGYGKTQDNQ
jgi:hypothetical protein